MNSTRRELLAALAGLMMAAPSYSETEASYPDRPIRIIVPRAPGGGSDIIARLLAPGLQKALGVSIVVENHPDSSTVGGALIVAHAKPDGYTVFLADNSFYQNPAVLPKLPYDTLKDFSAVTMIADGPVILIVKPSLPVHNLKELIALARKEPGKLTFASGGVGASTHLAGVLLEVRAGIKMVHVPYKGSGAALSALLGGQVDMQFGGISSAKPMVESGKVRAIAVSGDHRDPSMPDVPTLTEAGVKNADVMSVWGIHAPAGTPLAVRRKLRDAVASVLHDPTLAKRVAALGYHILASTPEEHQRQTEAIVKQWLDIGKKIDIRIHD